MAPMASQDKHLIALQVAPPAEALQQEVAAQVAAATRPLQEQVGCPPDHFLRVLIRLHQPQVCMLARSLVDAPALAATVPPITGLAQAPASVLQHFHIHSAKTGCLWLWHCCCAMQLRNLHGACGVRLWL